MLRDREKFNTDLTRFLDASPTPFHAVLEMTKTLLGAGFTELKESDSWSLSVGEKYFATRNGSSIIAFVVGKEDIVDMGIKMVGAHTDSPCLMVKPQPEVNKQGYFQLGVEVRWSAFKSMV